MSGSQFQYRVAGVAYIRVDGAQYALRGNLTVSIDGSEREGIPGQDGVHGYIERPRVPFIEGDLSDIGGLSLEALRRMSNVTVQAELANGKKYLLRNAWTAPAIEMATAEGQATVRWEGMRGEELMR
jgi:Phage tail tube protein